jgi:ribosomal protein L16 Arg81 hydroxylase
MTYRIETLADILYPVTEQEFFAEYYDRKALHVPAPDPDKFAEAMSWRKLSDLLNMSAIWTPATFKLFLDRKEVPPAEFCREDIDRDRRPTLQPDAERVKDWMRRGASLVVNFIDTLTPELAAVANAVESRLEGKVQSNLYCSWQQHRAFDTHMDTHDVFALHIAGEKEWNIYEGRLDRPIADPKQLKPTSEFTEKHRGAIETRLTLRPGDFLYLPRGKYHDALASSSACIHLTFGVTRVIGYNLLELLFNYAMEDSAFRANFPIPSGDPGADRTAISRHIDALADKLHEIAGRDAVLNDMAHFCRSFASKRGGYALPDDIVGSDAGAVRFALTSAEFAVVRANGKAGLKGPRGTVPIPGGIEEVVAWVVARKGFSRAELAAAFPRISEAGRERLIGDLSSMQVIGPG